MRTTWKVSAAAALVIAISFLLGLGIGRPAISTAQQPETNPARYTVVHTEGTNVIVTDNKSNTLFFYTVDPGNEPGAELKLRGSLDLNQVGKQTMTPKLLKK